MNRLNFRLNLIFIFLILMPKGSLADCFCTCINGENQPLCDNTLEIPPICAPVVCPIEPPAIEPIEVPSIPPIGTKECWQEQVLNPYTNEYEWQEVCQ